MKRLKKFFDVAYSPRHLLKTNTLTMCGIYGAADAIVQYVAAEDKGGEMDLARILRVSSIGLLHGPMNHFWYKWLDKRLVITSAATLAKKVGVDLSVSPVFAVTFIGGVAVLEGSSVSSALKEYSDRFFKVLKLDLCVWPPAQSINFWLVPSNFRVLYVSMVVLLYTCVLTFIRHSNVLKDEKVDHENKAELERIL